LTRSTFFLLTLLVVVVVVVVVDDDDDNDDVAAVGVVACGLPSSRRLAIDPFTDTQPRLPLWSD